MGIRLCPTGNGAGFAREECEEIVAPAGGNHQIAIGIALIGVRDELQAIKKQLDYLQ